MRWIEHSQDAELARGLAEHVGIGSVLANLLIARGFCTAEKAKAFINPALQDLENPLNLGGMPEAISRIKESLQRKESVLIFGDYDVDGITSIVLLTDILRRFGLNPRNVVPHRLVEGYGMTRETLTRAFLEEKPDLVIAVDCGTGSVDEVKWLREQDISVIILDHHTSKDSLPEDCVLVNPHVHDDDDAPWVNLCSVGLVFKFCHAFLKVMREDGDNLAGSTDLREYLDLVAMGTVADLVPLLEENRILVTHGLKRLKGCQRPGICSLIEIAGLSLGEELTPVDIGFRIGPRINASGRIDDAALPIKLLLSDNYQESRQIAKLLDNCNRERQDIERTITEHAQRIVSEQFSEDIALIVHDASWHAGVVGIVASRLARKHNRPAIVLASDSDGAIRGSGRSVKGVNLVEVLNHCTEHLQQWGGHPMAVGLTVEPGKLKALRECMNTRIRELFPDGLPESTVKIDAILTVDQLTTGLLEELDHLAPYGQGNPEPVFCLKQVQIRSIFPMGKDHFKFILQRTGMPDLDGVAWNSSQNRPPMGTDIDIAARFHWHAWRGVKTPRLTLMDWRKSSG